MVDLRGSRGFGRRKMMVEVEVEVMVMVVVMILMVEEVVEGVGDGWWPPEVVAGHGSPEMVWDVVEVMRMVKVIV